jgi:hypothetical protein
MVAARNEERVSRATYDSVGSQLDELVHESCALELVADLPMRPRLGVVVSGHVDRGPGGAQEAKPPSRVPGGRRFDSR